MKTKEQIREEEVIRVSCMFCAKERFVNKMLWDTGKQFKCDACNLRRFSKVRIPHKIGGKKNGN